MPYYFRERIYEKVTKTQYTWLLRNLTILSGMSRALIYNVLTDRIRHPNILVIQALARLYGVSMEDVLDPEFELPSLRDVINLQRA